MAEESDDCGVCDQPIRGERVPWSTTCQVHGFELGQAHPGCLHAFRVGVPIPIIATWMKRGRRAVPSR